ncbi:MAG: hypothetical protein QF371_03415, partial [Flavobacteriales bacterium]|nr:hypothetical protein [Flavobacteriales bacterium]
GEQLGAIGFDGSDGNTPDDARESSASIIAFASETHGTGDKGGHLTFWTSPTNQNDDTDGFERMRIDQGGNVGIGTTGPSQKLHVAGGARITSLSSGVVVSDASGNLSINTDLAPTGWGDNLGNHTATANLNMNNREIDNINYLDMRAGSGYGLRFWSSNSYAIAMGNTAEYRYGPVQDYSIKFHMNNDTDRGWTWGVDGIAPKTALDTEGHFQTAGNVTAYGHFYGRSVNAQYSNIYRMGGIYFTWDSDSYGTNTHHSIRSTYGNTYGDDVTLNSFNHIRFNLDANNNNSSSYFEIGNNTTGTGNTRVRIDETGQAIFANDLYLRDGAATSGDYLVRIFDSSDDGIIDIYENNSRNIRLHGNGTTVFNEQSQNNMDFRIESGANTNMFFMDASTNRIGIGTGTPGGTFEIEGDFYNQEVFGRTRYNSDQTVAWNAGATQIDIGSTDYVRIAKNDGTGTNNSSILVVASVSVSGNTITFADGVGGYQQVYALMNGMATFTVGLQRRINNGSWSTLIEQSAICGLAVGDWYSQYNGIANIQGKHGDEYRFPNSISISYFDDPSNGNIDYRLVFTPGGNRKNGGNYLITDRNLTAVQIKR